MERIGSESWDGWLESMRCLVYRCTKQRLGFSPLHIGNAAGCHLRRGELLSALSRKPLEVKENVRSRREFGFCFSDTWRATQVARFVRAKPVCGNIERLNISSCAAAADHAGQRCLTCTINVRVYRVTWLPFYVMAQSFVKFLVEHATNRATDGGAL
jgi:hypothetical protein